MLEALRRAWGRGRTSGRRRAPRLEHLEDRCTPATFTVNTLNDTPDTMVGNGQALDDAGNTSLRAAIMEANALEGNHTIQIVGQTGTINLGTALPGLARSIFINNDTGAAGLTVRRNSAAEFRIFEVGQGTTCVIGGLTLTNGKSLEWDKGGAILNSGALTVSACVITGNAARHGGAIANNDIVGVGLMVYDTTFSNNWAIDGNGGALHIARDTTAELVNCTLTGNVAHLNGGAVYNDGTFTLRASLVTFNTATTGNGGGAYNKRAISVHDSNFTQNRCQAAGAKGGAAYTNGTSASFMNTVFDNNQATTGSAIYKVDGTPLADILNTYFVNTNASGPA